MTMTPDDSVSGSPFDVGALGADPVQATAESGRWITFREAQRQLGISDRTLHRRLAAGRYSKRTRPDGRLEVFLPLSASHDVSADSQRQNDSGDEGAAADRQLALLDRFGETVRALVAPLQNDLREARQQVERLARENGELSRELAHLRDRLAQVEQQQTATLRSPDTSGQSVRPARRPWWRWW